MVLAVVLGAGASTAAEPVPTSGARVEARSPELLAVGTVRGTRMIIHLSRIADNSPVHDAAVSVLLRGTPHPAVAEADGSYSLDTPDLEIPGAAAVEFQIVSGSARQDLSGTLEVAGQPAQAGDKGGGSRQLGWWVLNFGVCIGFLWLWSRRKKLKDDADEST
jgi:cobalt-zinc-cadmium efflux system membrane fusion protein